MYIMVDGGHVGETPWQGELELRKNGCAGQPITYEVAIFIAFTTSTLLQSG